MPTQNNRPLNAVEEERYYATHGWYRQLKDDGKYQWYPPCEDTSQEDFNREIGTYISALFLKQSFLLKIIGENYGYQKKKKIS